MTIQTHTMTPFILLGRKKLLPEAAPSPTEIYDDKRQLWVDQISGTPLVQQMKSHSQNSQYGETTITETREGVDQSEGVSMAASQYGETTHTATREGIDQTESTALQASPFGETTVTKTREGADQTESASYLQASQYGETLQTRTREGVDQTESAAFSASTYGETTLTNTREGADQADQTDGLSEMTFDAPHTHF